MKAVLLEISKHGYTERRDWLDNEDLEEFDFIDEDKYECYTKLFVDIKDANKFIDEITEGFDQYWFDISEQTDGDEVSLQYHNGSKWDTEIYITIRDIRLDENFIKHVKEL